MKKIASAFLLGTLLCGSAMATNVDLTGAWAMNTNGGVPYNGFTFNYGFRDMLDGPVIGLDFGNHSASISYDAGSFNLHSMKLEMTPYNMSGSGSLGFDFTPYQLTLDYKDINGQLVGSQQITVESGASYYPSYAVSANNIHEIVFSTTGDHNPRLGGFNITPVPEPETYGMLLAGLGLVGFMARRKRANAAA